MSGACYWACSPRVCAHVASDARRATAHQFGPFQLGAKVANDMCRFCPTCSNKADEEDKAPLPPGLTKTDERSPLHMVSGDGNAKATRFANAGKAQKDVKKAVCFFFGEADKTFAATVNAAAPVQQTAAVPQDRMCGGKGGSHLRCVKTDNIKSQMFSSLGMVLFMCSHGIPIVGSGINCVVHGARRPSRWRAALYSELAVSQRHPCTLPENMTMYDCVLDVLRKERKLAHFVLDNNCLYKQHALKRNCDDDLIFLTPSWHALSHVYVRTDVHVCVCSC